MDRKGGCLLSNGDVHMERCLQRAGYGCYYDPAIQVRHHVPASRMTAPWFLNRFYWQGVSDAVMDRELTQPSYAEGLRRAARIARTQQVGIRRVARLMLNRSDTATLPSRCLSMFVLGQFAGYLRLRG